MKPVFEKLEALEIVPAGKTRQIQEAPTSHEIIDRVIRRAEASQELVEGEWRGCPFVGCRVGGREGLAPTAAVRNSG